MSEDYVLIPNRDEDIYPCIRCGKTDDQEGMGLVRLHITCMTPGQSFFLLSEVLDNAIDPSGSLN